MVVIVNPSDEALLQSKAPKLWTWSGSAKVNRFVVNQSADTFLADLRTSVWKSFIERLHRESVSAYVALTGRHIAEPPPLPSHLSCDDLYTLHLDVCGAPKGYVARKKRPENSMQILGAVQIGLLARGAQLDGNHYLLNNTRIRVVNGQGRILSAVRKLYQEEPVEFIKAETIVCVGAKYDGEVPPDIVRGESGTPTIVRPVSPVNWLTEDNAKHVWAAEGDHDVVITATR